MQQYFTHYVFMCAGMKQLSLETNAMFCNGREPSVSEVFWFSMPSGTSDYEMLSPNECKYRVK